MNNGINKDSLLTTEEVRRRLNLKTTTEVVLLIKTGELPGYRIRPRSYRIKPQDLESYIDGKRYQVATL
jgi:excisionase family DNA binding protein